MLILCIESSCDETSAAVIRDGSEMLSNVVASQVDVHSRFGGVVPELASRKHVEAISVVINSALQEAGVTVDQLEGIGVTRGPGLIGALLVGLSTALGSGYPPCSRASHGGAYPSSDARRSP
jgi:N6-L-threonylcarbamoyladenine synthase